MFFFQKIAILKLFLKFLKVSIFSVYLCAFTLLQLSVYVCYCSHNSKRTGFRHRLAFLKKKYFPRNQVLQILIGRGRVIKHIKSPKSRDCSFPNIENGEELCIRVCFIFLFFVLQMMIGLRWVIYHIKALSVVIRTTSKISKSLPVSRKTGLKFWFFV